MSRFVKKTVGRLDLGKGDWVDLRQVAYGERMDLQKTLFGYRKGEKSKGEKAIEEANDLQMRAANVGLLLKAIVAWGGPGFCSLADHDAGETHKGECVPVPVTAGVIDGMDETADTMLEELQRLRATSDFIKPPSPPTKDTEGAETKMSPSDAPK